MSKMMKCKTCGVDIASSAKSCPSCGAKNKKPFYTKWWFWVLAILIVSGALGGNQGSTSTSRPTSSSSPSPSPSPSPSQNSTTDTTDTTTTTDTTDTTETKKEDKIAKSETVGEKAALDKSNDYLSIMHFSKEGLREQLEFEGFTTEEIDYAINNQSVDWSEQALGKGKEYMNTMSFSKTGLKEQLLFDGFTDEQATYAVNEIFQ